MEATSQRSEFIDLNIFRLSFTVPKNFNLFNRIYLLVYWRKLHENTLKNLFGKNKP